MRADNTSMETAPRALTPFEKDFAKVLFEFYSERRIKEPYNWLVKKSWFMYRARLRDNSIIGQI